VGGKARGKSGLDKLLKGGEADRFEHLLFRCFIGAEVAGEEREVFGKRMGRGEFRGSRGVGGRRSGNGHPLKVIMTKGLASKWGKLVRRGWE